MTGSLPNVNGHSLNRFPPLPWGGRWLRPQPFFMCLCLCAAVPVPEPVSVAANRVCAGVYVCIYFCICICISLSVPVAVCAEAGILTVCAVHSGLYMPYAQYTVYMLNILYMLYMHGGILLCVLCILGCICRMRSIRCIC